MKRVLLMVAALVMVVSGVAAVSAYEAHLINVTARVENALDVETTPIDFGTVFPEEWLGDKILVQLSTSAVGEIGPEVGDLESVDFKVYAEWKPCEGMGFDWDDNGTWTPGTGYYNWMGYFTYVGWNTNGMASQMNLIGGPPEVPSGNIVSPGTAAKEILGGPYTLDGPGQNEVYVSIDVPDFEGYWNDLTDVNPKPSGESKPTYVVPTDMPGFDQNGMDFGLDLKIQVVDINRVAQSAG